MYQHTVVAVNSPFGASLGAADKRGAVTEARCSSNEASMLAQAFVFQEREAEDGEEWKREGWPDAEIGGRT